MHAEGMKFREQEQMWRNLAANSQALPPGTSIDVFTLDALTSECTDMEQLIQSQPERTFVAIQSDESGTNSSCDKEYSNCLLGGGNYDYNYSSTYDDSAYNTGGSYGGYDQSYNQSYDSYDQSGYYGGGGGLGTATALYDFAGEQVQCLHMYLQMC